MDLVQDQILGFHIEQHNSYIMIQNVCYDSYIMYQKNKKRELLSYVTKGLYIAALGTGALAMLHILYLEQDNKKIKPQNPSLNQENLSLNNPSPSPSHSLRHSYLDDSIYSLSNEDILDDFYSGIHLDTSPRRDSLDAGTRVLQSFEPYHEVIS